MQGINSSRAGSNRGRVRDAQAFHLFLLLVPQTLSLSPPARGAGGGARGASRITMAKRHTYWATRVPVVEPVRGYCRKLVVFIISGGPLVVTDVVAA